MAALVATAPMLAVGSRSAWGFSGGPPAGTTGAPGERTCGACHRGPLPLADSLILIAAPYQPGRPQRIRITTLEQGGAYGFQASLRFWGEPRQSAGRFRALPGQRLACATTDSFDEIPKTSEECPASHPLEYLMHAHPAFEPELEIEWIAPSRTTEPVVLYVAFNSVNGDGSFGGDRFQHTAVWIPPAHVRSGRRP